MMNAANGKLFFFLFCSRNLHRHIFLHLLLPTYARYRLHSHSRQGLTAINNPYRFLSHALRRATLSLLCYRINLEDCRSARFRFNLSAIDFDFVSSLPFPFGYFELVPPQTVLISFLRFDSVRQVGNEAPSPLLLAQPRFDSRQTLSRPNYEFLPSFVPFPFENRHAFGIDISHDEPWIRFLLINFGMDRNGKPASIQKSISYDRRTERIYNSLFFLLYITFIFFPFFDPYSSEPRNFFYKHSPSLSAFFLNPILSENDRLLCKNSSILLYRYYFVSRIKCKMKLIKMEPPFSTYLSYSLHPSPISNLTKRSHTRAHTLFPLITSERYKNYRNHRIYHTFFISKSCGSYYIYIYIHPIKPTIREYLSRDSANLHSPMMFFLVFFLFPSFPRRSFAWLTINSTWLANKKQLRSRTTF